MIRIQQQQQKKKKKKKKNCDGILDEQQARSDFFGFFKIPLPFSSPSTKDGETVTKPVALNRGGSSIVHGKLENKIYSC
jgi:hypothetical protein